MTHRVQRPYFRLFIRAVGAVALLALPCALMPSSAMNAVHQGLGMGELPHEPIVGYLARSTSAFYALIGGLLWVVSFDLPRHRLVLCYLGLATILLGALLLGVDFLEGLPRWWCFVEGPSNLLLGTIIFFGSTSLTEPQRPTAEQCRTA